MKDTIITTFIRQDLANKSLFMNALAQIIIKVLYQADMKRDDIYENIYNIVQHKIDGKRINSVLDELLCSKKITSKYGILSLSETYRMQVVECEKSRNFRYKKAIEKYFKNSTLEENILENLFDDINVAFFEEYNNEWIEDFIGRSRSKRTYVENFKALVGKSIFSKHNIKNDTAEWFFSQYLSFLRSNDPENGLLMLDYANSLFAAKLLSANIFADTSAKEMFQKTKVILDTNILLCLNLEKDIYSEAYKALEEIFILLEIEPIYFHITKEEYSRVIEYKIDQIKKVVDNFDREVIAHSDDVFLQTLLFRNCNSEEDFDRFYNSLREIPGFLFQELSIKEYDNREIIEHIEKEIAKKKLQKEMNEIHLRYHGFSKRENSLNHDAGIISGLDYIKETSPTWILTRDGTVHTYSIEHARIGELPLAINLSSLIHLLCINNGGIDGNSMDFGPLFSQFIKNDIIPLTDTFQLEDLTRMSEIEALVSQLPNDSIINLAKEINHDKLKDEPDRKIALKIQRSIQSHKIEAKDELESTRDNLQNTEEREKNLLIRQENMKTNFKLTRRKELCDRILSKFRFFYWGRFFLQIGIIIFVSFLLYRIIGYRVDVIVSVIISLVANILIGSISYKMFWLPNYFKKKKEKEAEIEDIVNEEWDKLYNK
jgi:hypothetical protein